MSEEFVRRVRQLSPKVTDFQGAVKDFDKVILSKRRASSIDTFEALVMLLVKRDFVDPLEKSTWVNLNDVCLKYCGEPFCQPSRPMDHNPMPQKGTHLDSRLNGSDTTNLLHPDGPVVSYLSRRITHNSWRNFARGLRVTEGAINMIEREYKHLGTEACVKEVLASYKRDLLWSSPSGDIIEDIFSALKLLKGTHFVGEFKNVVTRLELGTQRYSQH